MRRREFLKFLLAAPLMPVLAALAKIRPTVEFVRPPGAVVEEEFLALCTRCEACIEACLTGTLEPVSPLASLAAWGTPRVNPLKAPCEFLAGRCEELLPCIQACPTGALRIVEVSWIKLGSVEWIKENCIAYRYGGGCLVCKEVCPVPGAIRVKGRAPSFNWRKCVGCGRCVYACPADPKALKLTARGARRVQV